MANNKVKYNLNRKRKFSGDIGGGTIDETIMNFLKSISEMKQKIEGEDADAMLGGIGYERQSAVLWNELPENRKGVDEPR